MFWRARIELARICGSDPGLVKHDIRAYRQQRVLAVKLLEAFGRVCVYCDGVADTMDHVVPKWRGGPRCPCNLVAACKACNNGRSYRTIEDFVSSSGAAWARDVEGRLLNIAERRRRARLRLLAAMPREVIRAASGLG